MKPSKPANPAKSNNKNGSSDWLSAGTICLFAGGVLAAKAVLLVDNDLEIKTKFAGKSWQLNSQSVRQFANDIQKTARPYLHPVGENLRQQSTKLVTQAGDVLTDRKNLCVSTSELSKIVGTAKNSYPIESANPAPAKIDRTASPSNKVVKSANRSNSTTNANPAVKQSDRGVQNWCITSGSQK
jgi:hypothetical protein